MYGRSFTAKPRPALPKGKQRCSKCPRRTRDFYPVRTKSGKIVAMCVPCFEQSVREETRGLPYGKKELN